MKSHIVINFLIVDEGKVLLERINGKYWKLPGGHVDDNESPIQTVIREAEEELGLTVEFVEKPKLFVDEPNSKCLPTPYGSFVHIVESDSKLKESHANIIFTYAVIPRSNPVPKEGQEIQWFTTHELQSADLNNRVRAIAEAGLQYCHDHQQSSSR